MTSDKEEESFSSIEEIKKVLEHYEKSGNDCFGYNLLHIARQLISEEFINNGDPLTRIQTAIYICKIIAKANSRSPYTDSQNEKILRFYIRELRNLKKNLEYHSEYTDFVKNLENTKAYNLGFELSNQETREQIFENLFTVIFDLVDEDLEEDLKSCMFSILNSVLKQSRNFSFDHLHSLFQNIVEPQKKSRKEACKMTIKLLKERQEDLEGFLTNYINLIKEDGEQAIETCKLYEIAYELRKIFPKVIRNTMLFYAESKIKSPLIETRITSITFLGKLFSAADSKLACTEENIFSNFLGRIKDPSVEVRLLLIEFFKRIILKHPEVRIITSLHLRQTQVDPETRVRIEGVTSISKAIFKDIRILEGNVDLKQFLRGVKPDTEYSVRKAELATVAIVFQQHIKNYMKLSPELRKALLSIQTRILYAYSATASINDKCLIEKLFRDSLVSYELPSKERMKRLYHLYSTLDFSVLKSFAELHENKFLNRKILAQWVQLIKDQESRDEIREEFRIMTKYKEGPMGSAEFVNFFENYLMKNDNLVSQLEIIVDPHVSCNDKIDAFNNIRDILSKLEEPFCEEAWELIDSGTSLIFDHEAFKDLISCVFESLNGGSIGELDLNPTNAGDRGLKLLKVLANYFPTSFEFAEIPELFINYLKNGDEVRRSLMLSLLATLGKRKYLYEIINSDSILEFLISTTKKLAIEGTPKESKQSIRCLKFSTPNFEHVYEEILESMNLQPSSDFFLGSVIALGHIALERPEGKCHQVEDLIQKIIDYLRDYKANEVLGTSGTDWCSENELSKTERSYEEAIKCVARWIYGLEDSDTLIDLANNFFDILNSFLLEPYSLKEPTKNRLRAKAACAILKICERKELRHSIPLQIFYDLSKLMNDKSTKASILFVRKLIKGLKYRLPERFLTNEFLGFFVLAGKQEERMIAINSALEVVIARRNFFLNYLMNTAENNIFRNEELKERIFEWLPEFSIVYALPILARDPDFTEINYLSLKRMEKYLWPFLQLIVEKSDFNCSILLKKIGEELKLFGDAQSSNLNEKLGALNELFLLFVKKRIKKGSAKVFEVELKIPRTHYTEIQLSDHHEFSPSLFQRSKRTSVKKKLSVVSTTAGDKRVRRT
ncbi:sister chromatid cohesion protein PDS5 homolog A-A-like isoform X1 [Belonocnema kinseyi]|uniref:sister chromatid cohesion protein PDS5 homolog A-A-like isoform X1 n=1 Tax=Belonocnema kinseyi TaxID=2817044 RepID=UPI00143DD877|nr:sister chromatid cohesion protein PDS5 homolog A-A-like isoform X1 [Belonocnema kinseyi]